MNLLGSFIIALGMYSALPMPQHEWNKKSMRYTMAFFPVIGLAIGICVWCWWQISGYFHLNQTLFAAGFTLIPVLITGGIHLDGFCDTMDALSSHAERERKLEILKDSNSGAFAVIGLASYFLLYFGFASQLKMNSQVSVVFTLGFVLSRALSGFAVASFQCAKNSGLVYTFADSSAKKQVRAVLSVLIILCMAGIFAINFLYGAVVFLICSLVFLYYRRMSYRQFGGITGDLAGFFLQICEFGILAGVVAVQCV
jgi:adenosylcobinamide-GDP ribazoletransferase